MARAPSGFYRARFDRATAPRCALRVKRRFGAGACVLGLLWLPACGGKSRFTGADGEGAGGAPAGVAGRSGTAASDSAGAGGEPATLGRVEQILDDGPWQVGQESTGIAVDPTGAIYVSDPDTVYRVDGDDVSVFLNRDDIVAAGAGDRGGRINDLDIDPEAQLTLAVSGYVLTSRTAHSLRVAQELMPVDQGLAKLGVVERDFFLLVTPNGMSAYDQGHAALLYDAGQLERTAGCAAEDLAVSGTGEFLYQPGCNPSPLMRGYADGSGVGVLYEAGKETKVPISASNFVCSARDPAGGFYVVTRNAAGLLPLLYHVNEHADRTDAARYLPTEPSLAALQNEEWPDPLAFYFCSIAVAPDGSIVFQTFRQLWRIWPY
jgi:hypothetical protein